MSRGWHVWGMVLVALALAGALAALPVRAGATIVVNSAFDSINPSGGKCTLREAIIAANLDKASGSAAGECAAGSGADTILVPAGTFMLTIAPSGLVPDPTTGDLNVTSTVTIVGAGESATIIDASLINARVLEVSASSFSLSNLRIQNGHPPNIAGGGGGLLLAGGAVQVKNSILAETSGTTCSGTVTSLGHNLDRQGQCNLHQPGDVNGVDPLLGPPAGNGGLLVGAAPLPLLTQALLPGSPAIDTGDNVDCPAADERGFKRPADGNGYGVLICDIGAYEVMQQLFLPLIRR